MNKILVSALALAMGAGLAGSISGTMAWYQYATRAQVSYIGTTAHCSELLQISVDGGTNWKNEFKTSDLSGNTTASGTHFVPVTSGPVAMDENVGTFYSNPIYQISGPNYNTWQQAEDTNYLQFTIKFRVADVNENGVNDLLDKEIFLLDLTLLDEDDGDLADALRVHFHTSDDENFLIAKDTDSTDTNGQLDLNGDTQADKTAAYEWESGSVITYGNGSQTSYTPADLIADDDNGDLSGGVPLGETAGGDDFSITVTIWLEGWQELGGSTIWDNTNYVNKQFQVGMRFGVDLHDNVNE